MAKLDCGEIPKQIWEKSLFLQLCSIKIHLQCLGCFLLTSYDYPIIRKLDHIYDVFLAAAHAMLMIPLDMLDVLQPYRRKFKYTLSLSFSNSLPLL